MSLHQCFVIYLLLVAVPQNSIKFKGAENARQDAVVDVFRRSWHAYRKFAWGFDELCPISKKGSNSYEIGLTIIDSLDTAIIMNLNEEVEESLDWINTKLKFNHSQPISVFETTIRVLGGLLSAYHLTGNTMLIQKAENLGYHLLDAFEFGSIFPRRFLSANNKKSTNLAEIGTLQLEFRDLARETGVKKFEEITFKISEYMHERQCSQKGLCKIDSPWVTNDHDFIDEDGTYSVGANADSYYEYLLKQWLQTNKTINWLREDFIQSMAVIDKMLLKKYGNLWYLGKINPDGDYEPEMDHLSCFLGGTLALSYYHNVDPNHLIMAEKIAETCYEMYKTPTGLAPEVITSVRVVLNKTKTKRKNRKWWKNSEIYISRHKSQSFLRPEAIEAWFYLYRITGNKKYQEWGWKVFKAIEKIAAVPSGGYSSIKSVIRKKIKRIDKMESFFLAETLKYLFLLFSDDQSLLPIDQWVFNTEAHPIPIRNN